MTYVVIWWLWVELLGIICLPLSFTLFRNLPDKGYAFGKALGILILSYLLWLACLLRILPNTRLSIFILLIILALGSLYAFTQCRRHLIAFLSKNWRVILGTEAVFLFFFLLWALVRAYSPGIQHTEQPMDFAFLNGILRSEHFPPNDPWLSGHSISYYYFGYLMVAMLTKLSAIPSSVAFNLALALIMALAASGASSLVCNLVWRERNSSRVPWVALGFGLVGAVFLVILGNLEGVLEMLYAHNVGSAGFWHWVDIQNISQRSWWWWHATRILSGSTGPETITEFPFFSFLLGDLHPHVMSLPFTLLALALGFNILSSPEPLGLGWIKRHPAGFVGLALVLGGLSFLNSWDFPTFLFFFLAMVGIHTFRLREDARSWKGAILFGLAVTALSILLYLPFYMGPKVQASGIWLVRGISTRHPHYFLIWGLFGFVAVSLVGYLFARQRGWHLRRGEMGWALLPLIPFLLWAVLEFLVSLFTSSALAGLAAIGGKFLNLLPLLIILSVGLLVMVRLVRREEDGESPIFALGLILVGFLLIMGVELFYVQDIFGTRMNTVFKLYYQAWAMLAIASAFGIYWLGSRWGLGSLAARMSKTLWLCLLALLVIGAFTYPMAATWSRTDGISGAHSIDGLAYLQRTNPWEYQAIQWLNQKVEGSPVIVEAVGGSFTDYGRISSRTGLPTVIGWTGHEVQWRGSTRDFGGREADVARIYESQSISEVKALLLKYKVSYVYVGYLEMEKYRGDFDKFAQFMDVAFENEGVAIYRMRPE